MIRYLIIWVIALSFMQCSDENPAVNLEVKTGELLSYSLGNQPSEGGYIITQSPMNSILSEISIDTINGGIVYNYISNTSFIGVERVLINKMISIGDNSFREERILLEIDVLP